MITIFTTADRADLITAVEDSVLIEIFDHACMASDFPHYRKRVDDELR